MNISYTIFEANLADLTTAVLYDGSVGRFSLIAVTAEAIKSNLNATERTILDNYEEEFGVAEALMGPVPSGLIARYGVSSFGTEPRFTSLKWARNGLTNSMNTSMSITTLGLSTTVYAYGGNATQTNPVIWSLTSGNKIRVASSIRSLSPYTGDNFAYWVTFWLSSKLSSANKILKFYWSIDIDDIMAMYSDGGIFGAPPVSNLYFNGSDVQNMKTNLIAPYGFDPTLAVEYSDNGNTNMTTYPALYSALMINAGEFDFTPHSHELYQPSTTYDMALDIIRSDRNAISSWGFLPTLYYMVPGNYKYSRVTAPAITDSPVWYVAQAYSATSDTVPYLKQKLSLFDVWSPSLFRVARGSWTPWNLRTTGQVLVQSGKGTWDRFWTYHLEDLFGTSGFVTYWGGYRIEETHFANWVYGRESADAPSLQLIRNVTGISVLPVVPTRSWALAENFYFIRNFKFNATYNINQNTLTYAISKNNVNARDRITLVFEGKAKPVDFDPLMLKYDQNSTIVTLNYKTSITLKLGEQETTNPYITNYETSLLTAASLTANDFSFTIAAPAGTTSTTRVYAGVKGDPSKVLINGVQYNKGEHWTYDDISRLISITWTHSSEAQIVIDWTILNKPPVAVFTQNATTVLTGMAIHLDASGSYDPDGSIVSYSWNFGDGQTGIGATVDHAYTNVGTYTVTLTVTDDDGATETATSTITVLNRPPIASFTESATIVYKGEVINFNASSSYDPDGTIVSYFWTFGDGTNATGVFVSHAYSNKGVYTVTLKVTDSDGATGTSTATKTVLNRPPVASFTESATTVPTGQVIYFDASASYDPDGFIVTYFWTFGDRTNATGATVVHAYTNNGIYTVTLKVTDDDGATATATATKTVLNSPPVASFTESATAVYRGQVIRFNASASHDTDGVIVNYFWTFGDGTNATGMVVDHAYTSVGTYTGTLTVTDDDGAIATITSTITVLNRPPVAQFTESTTIAYTSMVIHFNASGSYDIDGSIVGYFWTFGDGENASGVSVSHAYVDNGVYTVTLKVTDNDGATATAIHAITVLNQPPISSLTESAKTVYKGQVIYFNASASYDPDGFIVSYFWNFGDGTDGTGVVVDHAYANAGTYTVTLTVKDNDGATASSSTIETVLNKLPIASFTQSATTAYTSEVIHFDALASYDPDGSITSYFWNFGDGKNATGVTVDHAYATNGTYTVTLTVTDNDGSTGTATATMTILNTPPDTTPPTITVISPINGSTVSRTTSIQVSVWDASGVDRTEFYIDGKLKSTDYSAPYVYQWNTKSVKNGWHWITVRAYDVFNNYSEVRIMVYVFNRK